MSRRERRILRIQGKKYAPDTTIADEKKEAQSSHTQANESQKKKHGRIAQFYENNVRKGMWVTLALLLISLIIIGVHAAVTGEFIPRGVSLKGGVTLTVPYTGEVGVEELQDYLRVQFPQGSISARELTKTGVRTGFIIDASDVDADALVDNAKTKLGGFTDFSLETMGGSLGAAFFKQTLFAMLIAFVLMSIVVFLSFKTFVPSGAVILSAFSDMVMTIAVIDIFGIKLETAGIAALLMLIGYSIDTDVLLTTRLLKRQEGTVMERVYGAMKTGMTMTITSISAVTVALLFTQSETLRQIMLILLIGLIFDILNTWIQNAGILLIYIDKLNKRKTAETLAEYGENAGAATEETVDADFEEVDEEGQEEEEHKAHEHKLPHTAAHTEHKPQHAHESNEHRTEHPAAHKQATAHTEHHHTPQAEKK
jgi:preprotein translocase subunit SecF